MIESKTFYFSINSETDGFYLKKNLNSNLNFMFNVLIRKLFKGLKY